MGRILFYPSVYAAMFFKKSQVHILSHKELVDARILHIFYPLARRESEVYRDPHVRPSARHTFGFRMIIKVALNQIFSNFHTFVCTIKYR
jgi:hypothetical protein